MFNQYICYLIIFILIHSILTCPIPFDIQSKCRCAITETGRVYIYCARKQLLTIPYFNNSNIIFDELVLSGNRISVVHKNAFNGLKLRKLELQSNPINRIDKNAFIDLANYLEEFILSTTLRTSQLTSQTFFQILFELPNLKRLSLRAKLEKKIFTNLPLLERLHLRDNQIEVIDSNTFQHTRLQSLDLRNNSLKIFPLLTKLNETLQILSLRRNQLCTIEMNSLNFYSNLLTLELDQNPLHCDCRMERNFKQMKITGQCESPPERRNVNLNELPNEQFSCSILTTSQCNYLTRTIIDDEKKETTVINIVEKLVNKLDRRQEESSPSTSTTTTATTEKFPSEHIRIADITITPNVDNSKLFIQWQLFPSTIDENSISDYRRKYFKHHGINGFKISTNSPIYKMSELLDNLQRNYTIDYISQGEICLYLLRKTNYEKFCKQLQITSTQILKSSLIIDPNQREQQQQQQAWYMNEPAKSIFIGSIFGILLVLVLLTCIILIISRCPYLLFCHLRSSKYHQNNDSKSESLLVRPTPTNTIPWSNQSQQHYYPAPPPPPPLSHHHLQQQQQHQLRPISYQASFSTQCTCPTHYHSSVTSSTTDSGSTSIHGQNYHIYQEILNDDFNLQNHHRTCRSLKTDNNSLQNTSSSMNSEQCQLCSLSVLV
ncbi:hypothetical protein I4U23_026402 [Adineta vaga]|nr:hypothetical protein I4U23_026402 [Adineta vaga]